MTQTKIVATLGPVSAGRDMIERFIDAGVDVVRLNMSHGTHADHARAVDAVRDVAAERGRHIAVIADLCGPKVRTGDIEHEPAVIGVGDTCTIERRGDAGSATRFTTNHPALVDDVDVGHRVLIADGSIRLLVIDKRPDALICTCTTGGRIAARMGINVPDARVSLPAVTDKDRADIAWAVRRRVDFVAMSFVRGPEDLAALRAELARAGADPPVIAKIETPQAVAAIDAVIDAADALLVARGDLGVEMDVARIPTLQKDLIARCRAAGKPVIVATQMLHSMVHRPTPTRAEATDVANAVLDGTDAVMLSEESAVGRFPVEAIRVMNRIIQDAQDYESNARARPTPQRHPAITITPAASSPPPTAPPTTAQPPSAAPPPSAFPAGPEPHHAPAPPASGTGGPVNAGPLAGVTDRTTAAVAHSAALICRDLGARLVVVWSDTGRTAAGLSKYRIHPPIVGLSASDAACRRLALCFGVEPMLVAGAYADGTAPWADVQATLAERFRLHTGDVLVVVGDPERADRRATIRIHVIGEP
ncbi:MAG: pyruvate kinase [Phycisphaerae bacterium]